jgi:hypothetical protein
MQITAATLSRYVTLPQVELVMTEVTRILSAIERGDPSAAEQYGLIDVQSPVTGVGGVSVKRKQ